MSKFRKYKILQSLIRKGSNPDKLYISARNFTDLLNINIAFLKNKIDRTYYYLSPFGEGCGSNHIESREDLIKLHYYGIYTIEGQSDYYMYEPETTDIYGNILKEFYERQRSYLEFICPPSIGSKLLDLLLHEESIYIYYYSPTKNEEIITIPEDVFNLTYCEWNPNSNNDEEDNPDYYTNWSYDIVSSNIEKSPFHNVNNIINSYTRFFVVNKEYGGPIKKDNVEKTILNVCINF